MQLRCTDFRCTEIPIPVHRITAHRHYFKCTECQCTELESRCTEFRCGYKEEKMSLEKTTTTTFTHTR
jgi:hypothetical protein